MDAFLIIDLQRDFISGSLAVPGAERVISVTDRLAQCGNFRYIVASRDLHPCDHSSFTAQEGIWPEHCVNGSRGAALAPAALNHTNQIVSKGRYHDRDAYSAFDETHLADLLHAQNIDRITVSGLATDYCVRASVLDALEAGFQVQVVTDAIAAVDLHPGDGQTALDEMAAQGATLVTSAELIG